MYVIQCRKFVSILYRNDAHLSTIATLEFETCNFVYAYYHSECPIDNQIVYVIDISVNMNVSNCIGNFYHNSIFSWIVLCHIFLKRNTLHAWFFFYYDGLCDCPAVCKISHGNRIYQCEVIFHKSRHVGLVTYIKSNIIIDPILISTCFYEIAQITYEKIFHVYARFFCLQYKIWLQYILIDVMQGIFDSLVCSLCKRMIDDKSYL